LINQPIPHPAANADTITEMINHSEGIDKSSFMIEVLGITDKIFLQSIKNGFV
jgi:hypothetical protein